MQCFLPKQVDLDKILKIIQRTVLKETHLAVSVKEIQVEYLNSPYFKDVYLYLACNEWPLHTAAMQRTETLEERYLLLHSLLFRLNNTPGKVLAV